MIRFLLSALLVLSFLNSAAQESVQRELHFVRHLIGRNEFKEGLFILENLEVREASLLDSVNYYHGWIRYQQKDLLPSAAFLLKVSTDSPLFEKSRFFASYNLAHAGQISLADSVLEQLHIEQSGVLFALQNFERAGIALLRRDFDDFDNRSGLFLGDYNAFALQERNLAEYAAGLQQQPVRSAAVAGLLSAAVPGLGKVYAGKTAEGIAGFLYVGAMALTSYDFYRRSGPANGFFIFSATVTGIFYVGNIWGSAVAVSRKRNEFNHEMDQRILFDMHIPLRNIFQ